MTAADKPALRRSFGRFATGVTIVTCARGEAIFGMTANSFTSVSLDPPLVLVSIGNQTRMASILREAGHYGLNILSLEQQHLSNHFAGKPGDHEISYFHHGEVPLIEGAHAHLICRICDIHPAGDHSLFIGEVIHHCPDNGQSTPLLFYRGSYHRLMARHDERPRHV